MWSSLQKAADLVTFTEEIGNGKLDFLCRFGAFFDSIKFVTWDSTLYTNFIKHLDACDSVELE